MCLLFSRWAGVRPGLPTSIVVCVSLKKSRKSGNHTVSKYDNVTVVFSKIGVLIPDTYWFQCNAILKIRFASDWLLHQCLNNDSTFASPCSCRKIRISILLSCWLDVTRRYERRPDFDHDSTVYSTTQLNRDGEYLILLTQQMMIPSVRRRLLLMCFCCIQFLGGTCVLFCSAVCQDVSLWLNWRENCTLLTV